MTEQTSIFRLGDLWLDPQHRELLAAPELGGTFRFSTYVFPTQPRPWASYMTRSALVTARINRELHRHIRSPVASQGISRAFPAFDPPARAVSLHRVHDLGKSLGREAARLFELKDPPIVVVSQVQEDDEPSIRMTVDVPVGEPFDPALFASRAFDLSVLLATLTTPEELADIRLAIEPTDYDAAR